MNVLMTGAVGLLNGHLFHDVQQHADVPAITQFNLPYGERGRVGDTPIPVKG